MAARTINNLITHSNTIESQIIQERNSIGKMREKAYGAAVVFVMASFDRVTQTDVSMVESRTDSLAQSSAERSSRQIRWLREQHEALTNLTVFDHAYTAVLVLGNAAVDTIVSFFTVGFVDGLHVFGGVDRPGYMVAYIGARFVTELAFGFATGSLSLITKVGWVGKIGKGIFLLDVAGNGLSVARGAKGWIEDGELNFTDALQLGGGAFGLGGNWMGRASRASRATSSIGGTGGGMDYSRLVDNPDGASRLVNDAADYARSHGIKIGDDVKFRVKSDAEMDRYGNISARYGFIQRKKGGSITWDDLADSDGKMIVWIRASVLRSNQKIIATFAHEMHEINSLSEGLKLRGMRSVDYDEAVNPRFPGNVHHDAIDAAEQFLKSIWPNLSIKF